MKSYDGKSDCFDYVRIGISHDERNAYDNNGYTTTFVLGMYCYKTKLHVRNVRNNGDTSIKSGFKSFTFYLAFIHCSIPLDVISQSINYLLYFTPNKNYLCSHNIFHIYGKLFYYLNLCEAMFNNDSAWRIRVMFVDVVVV